MIIKIKHKIIREYVGIVHLIFLLKPLFRFPFPNVSGLHYIYIWEDIVIVPKSV